ncbi:uncharacterized protein LOC124123368 [Haliotis rufescens]|uniref:uncharacterized protein LOC124123368 n=1 Tax=Haliotis rufescens TaxID=6454 RepID=UPI001EB0AC27|nr:uncharacterized protein LOC124123368 [Haliotis rufescens]
MMETQSYQMTLSADGSKSEILYPHLSYSAYSGSGGINPWFLTRCLESGRFLSMSNGFCHSTELLSPGGMFVTMRMEYAFKWELLCSATVLSYFPYKIVVTLQNVGRTSLVWRHRMINRLDNKTLVSLDATMVLLNRKTRKPVAFPSWFLDKYGRFTNEAIRKSRILIPDVPPSPMSFSQSIAVMPSSVDVNDHLNNSEYIRFALDCVAVASGRHQYAHVKGDVRRLWLVDLSIYYRREGFQGDDLTVTSWEGDNPGDVMCVVRRSDDILTVLWMRFRINKAHL